MKVLALRNKDYEPRLLIYVLACCFLASLPSCRTGQFKSSQFRPEKGTTRVFMTKGGSWNVGGSSFFQPDGIVMENAAIRVVVSPIGKMCGISPNGGDITTAISWDENRDSCFGQLVTGVGVGRLLPVYYRSLQLRPPASAGHPASVFLQGECSVMKSLQVETEYILPPDTNIMTIRTKVINTGAAIERLHLGDMALWGELTPFIPGPGSDISGTAANAPWIAGSKGAFSWGLFRNAKEFSIRQERQWTEILSEIIDLSPLGSVTFERTMIVGTGGPAIVSDAWRTSRNQPRENSAVPVETVVYSEDGRPIAGAVINFHNSDGDYATAAVTDKRGKASCLLEPGRWRMMISSEKHLTLRNLTLDIKPDTPFSSVVRLPPRIALTVSLFEETETGRRPTIGKITLEAVSTAQNERPRTIIITDNPTIMYVEPGQYVITASRGPTFTIHTREIQIYDGSPHNEEFVIRRVFRPCEYISIDSNLTLASGTGGALPVEKLAKTCLAEGLDGAIVDADVLRCHNLQSDFLFIPSVRLWNHRWGVFNLVPASKTGINPNMGIVPPAEFFKYLQASSKRTNVVLCSPIDRRYGYISLVGLDTKGDLTGIVESPLDFDAIEFAEDQTPEGIEALLDEWFSLLNAGLRMIALGGSDSYIRYSHVPGYLRTCIRNSEGEIDIHCVDTILEKIFGEKTSFITNGPMIDLWVGSYGGIGSLTKIREGKARVKIQVEAAPWIDITELQIIMNGKVITTIPIQDKQEVRRYDAVITVPIERDSWILALVRGSRGLHPVVPGKGEKAVLPFAITNPVWIDADGDGRFSRLHLAH